VVPLFFSTPDQWSFDTGIELSAPGLSPVLWSEPGDAFHANFLSPAQLGGSLRILIASDVGISNPIGNPDGTVLNISYFDLSNAQQTLTVQFFDKGDVASPVPDGGSALGLLAASALGLFGVARVRFARCT